MGPGLWEEGAGKMLGRRDGDGAVDGVVDGNADGRDAAADDGGAVGDAGLSLCLLMSPDAQSPQLGGGLTEIELIAGAKCKGHARPLSEEASSR